MTESGISGRSVWLELAPMNARSSWIVIPWAWIRRRSRGGQKKAKSGFLMIDVSPDFSAVGPVVGGQGQGMAKG